VSVGVEPGSKPVLLSSGVDIADGPTKLTPVMFANAVAVVDDAVYFTDSDSYPPLPPIKPGGPWDGVTAFGLNTFTVSLPFSEPCRSAPGASRGGPRGACGKCSR
jgi:hypothetical protein